MNISCAEIVKFAENYFETFDSEEKNEFKNLFYSNLIPAKKLLNSKKSYASLSDKEKVIFLNDDTMFGSGKDGFIILTVPK